jgi:2-polyprenyl-6-methoxyphenol hydroxylase-like FAD-dependent oxidoreductase
VRKLAGIGFPVTAATRWALLGDVELEDRHVARYGMHENERGTVFVIPRPGYVRVIVGDPSSPADRDRPVALDELASAVER